MKVTKDNAVVGLKVTLDEKSEYKGQDRGSVYGEIVEHSNCFPKKESSSWVRVAWKDEDGKTLKTNDYQIGAYGKFDLNVYEAHIVPEYVECIKCVGNSYTVGKIYQINDKGSITTDSGYRPDEKFELGKVYYSSDIQFKLSSKEAFDLQHNTKKTEDVITTLEKDQYYYTADVNGLFSVIFKVVNPIGDSCNQSKRCIGTYITSNKFYDSNTSLAYYTINSDDKVTRNYRKATQIEIDWLDFCIKEGKYVSMEEFTKSKEPELLVFGKFKIGSIVVCTKVSVSGASRKIGDIVKINTKSTYNELYYTSGSSTNIRNKDDWRQATPEECKAFEQGITNIKDIKTEEDLVGRYIKALKNRPNAGSVLKDEIGLILSIGVNQIAVVDFPSQKGYAATLYDKSLYELMPIGFTPEEPINTYGLKVGDKIPFKVIYNWIQKANNYLCNGNWTSNTIEQFNCNDLATINKFILIKGIVSVGINNWNYSTNGFKAEGFKEFMDNFDKPKNTNTMELPKEWCIKRTAESQEFIEKWGKKLKNPLNWYYTGTYYGYKNNNLYCNTISFGKELTLDEFKRLVLKESDLSNPFKIDDYVEVHTDSDGGHKIGTVGIVKDIYGASCEVYVANTGRICNTYSHNFKNLKLSTKAAYEAQGNPILKEYKSTDWEVGINPAQPSPDSSIEEILEYCKIKYPVGTKFRSPENGNIYTVFEYPKEQYWTGGKLCLACTNKTGSGEYIYYRGKFAKLVQESDTEEELPFKHGDLVEVLDNGFHIQSRGLVKVGDLKTIKHLKFSQNTIDVTFTDNSGGYWRPSEDPFYYFKIVNTQLKKEDFYNTKIDVSESEETSRLVQEKLFELGFTWRSNSKNYLKYKERYLVIDNNEKFGAAHQSNLKQIYPQDLGININNKQIKTINNGKQEIKNNNNSISKVQGFNKQISNSSGARGIGLERTGSKISLGTFNSPNKVGLSKR